jgi:alkanesulfonate monooxygenase SsuD/methylene tetrahydromethanopterin reductase-like flavin-dependent oxidoreductase (luciferase family)
MEFSLFVHMERYDPAKPHRELLDEVVELVQLAEAGGFRTAWIGEHWGMEFTIAPNPLMYFAYLADKTSRIRLGTGTIIAPFWQPVRLASEAALADVMTGGRVELGIARGAYQFEFDRVASGMPAMEGGKHLREMIPALQGLWSGHDYAQEGEVYSFPPTVAVPHPVQSPHPPIWIAARDPATHEFAIEHGCQVQVTPLAKGDDEVEDLARKFDGAVAAHPERPRPKLMLLRHGYVVATPGEREAASRAVLDWYAHFEAWVRKRDQVRDGFLAPLTDEEMAAIQPFYTVEQGLKNHVIGTPDEVIARLRHYEQLGFDEFSLWIDNGESHERKRAMLDLWCREVVPAFQRDLVSSRFTPKA